MGNASYQLIFLGAPDSRIGSIEQALRQSLRELGLDDDSIAFLESTTARSRDRKLPTMGIFFGAASVASDSALVSDLIVDSIVIATIVTSLDQLQSEIPPQLRAINAFEMPTSSNEVGRLISLVLETFRLIRAERRLFISYRRADAQPLAERLYDFLDSHGFDVFLDVRSVPPAADFQSVLWHRMSDADVVVLVDTPGFRASRWTTGELARANATNIQILHLLWPGQPEDATSGFSQFLRLYRRDFSWFLPGKGRGINASALQRIGAAVERLRAKAMAARDRYLIDNLCDCARDLRMAPTVHSERWIAIPLQNGRTLAVVPAAGVPTSDRLNAVFDAVADPDTRDLWLLYDNRGILTSWLGHLDWLGSHLPIRAIRMSHAPTELRKLA